MSKPGDFQKIVSQPILKTYIDQIVGQIVFMNADDRRSFVNREMATYLGNLLDGGVPRKTAEQVCRYVANRVHAKITEMSATGHAIAK